MNRTVGGWHAAIFIAADVGKRSIVAGAKLWSRSTNGSSRYSNYMITCGIVAWKTTKHNCWQRSSAISCSCATITAMAEITAECDGYSTDFEFPDTLN